MDLNVNNAACMVQKSHFAYDTYVNICTGKSVDIAWAFQDWLGFGFLIACAVFLVVAVLGIIAAARAGY